MVGSTIPGTQQSAEGSASFQKSLQLLCPQTRSWTHSSSLLQWPCLYLQGLLGCWLVVGLELPERVVCRVVVVEESVEQKFQSSLVPRPESA